jgi:predicted methyltransferase
VVFRLLAPLCAFALVAGCAASAPTIDGGASQRLVTDRAAIDAAVADPRRLAEDRERDPSSKPADVLELFGIAAGMRVLDLNAATGYYTEILARIVGPEGRVIAHNHPGARTTLRAEDFERRYGGGRLPNVEQLFARHADIDLPDASLDAVLMSTVYHDLYWSAPGVDWGPIDARALLRKLYRALKPGGIVGVIDHVAVAGSDPAQSAKSVHRIDPAVVRADFAAAGFRLEADSALLRNPADDHTASVFDASVHGATDRFVMRFRRPR